MTCNWWLKKWVKVSAAAGQQLASVAKNGLIIIISLLYNSLHTLQQRQDEAAMERGVKEQHPIVVE
jgi:hypothetical protein